MSYLYKLLIAVMMLSLMAGSYIGCATDDDDDNDDTTVIDDDDDDATGACEDQTDETSCTDIGSCLWLDVSAIDQRVYPTATSGDVEYEIVCIADDHPCVAVCDEVADCLGQAPLQCQLDCTMLMDNDEEAFQEIESCLDEAVECDEVRVCIPE